MSICPETVFVVEDKFGLCGYGVATADGRNFYDQYKDEWLPKVRTFNHIEQIIKLLNSYFVIPLSKLLRGRGHNIHGYLFVLDV